MKKELYLFMLFLVFLSSCKTETLVGYYSNGASFTVQNKTTGQEVHNVGITNSLPNLNVSNGDVIKLIYLPPLSYEQSDFQVVFKVFGIEYHVNTIPYEKEITINANIISGVYQIYCEATTTDWLDGSNDHGIVQVTVFE